MKIGAARDNLRVMAETIHARTAEAARRPTLDVGATYDAHADFVWRALHRMGVRHEDVADLLQEVFVVVHRRRADYDSERPVRGWLWGIALGLARNHRRKGTRSLEPLEGRAAVTAIDDPERALRRRRQRERGQRLLAELDPEKRAVFVMFEVEGLAGREIARLLDVPLGTVHSRLHAARTALAEALEAEDDR